MLSVRTENFPATINGLTIVVDQLGRINITNMLKQSGTAKRPYDWRRNKSSQLFIEETAKRTNKSENDVYFSDKSTGIWAHPFVALKIAGWISPAFDVSMMDIIFRYQTGDKTIVSEVLNISDTASNTITNVVSVAPVDSSQQRKTTFMTQNVADMSSGQIEYQRQLNERLPDILNLDQLPLNDDNTIDMGAIENLSPESIILNIVGCSRTNIKTYEDIVDGSKEQLALLYNERVMFDNEMLKMVSEYSAEIEQLRAAVAQLISQINNTIPGGDTCVNEFLDGAKQGQYVPLSNDYGEHLLFLRSVLMDVAISQNSVEKEQLAIVVSILKNILVPNLSIELPIPIAPALCDTSASPSFFQKNVVSFEDDSGNIGTYDTFELMGLDRPSIMERVCSLPNEWKAMMVARINCAIVRPKIDGNSTQIFIYAGYSAIIPTKKDLFIEFTTERMSLPGLSYMTYIGQAHLNKCANAFIASIGGKTKVPYQPIATLLKDHSAAAVVMSSEGLFHLM